MENPGNISQDPTQVVLDPGYSYSSQEMKKIMNARAQVVWEKKHGKSTKKPEEKPEK